jgi:flagellar protein FliS
MLAADPYSKYRKDVIFSATQEDLTLMLYDGALKFANQAIMAIEKNEIESANNFIIRTQNIIREFQLTLKPEYDVSAMMMKTYDYIHARLVDANIYKDMEQLVEARDMIRELRNTWKEAMKIARQNQPKVALQ